MTTTADVIIIGAGASGMACAVTCARGGKKVILLEKEIVAGRKILVTGNGRCNFTNESAGPSKYFGDSGFIKTALENFTYKDCLSFFDSLGMLYRSEDGRLFPVTGKASSVADCLVNALNKSGADIKFKAEVTKITKTGDLFKVFTVDGQTFTAANIVLACGSMAYPQVGATEAGYNLAKSFGHTIAEPKPALCALNLREKAVARLAGLKVQADVSLQDNSGKIIDNEEGEIIFGAKGVSGNNILSISRNAYAGAKIVVDFFPQFSGEEFSAFISKRRADMADFKIKDFFAGILADNASNLLIDFLGIRKNSPVADIKADIFDRIIKTLKGWPFTVESLRPWKEATAARGGVSVKEIEPLTFMSKKTKGLFVTGELLDIDGRCGGYNLHFAWASGVLSALAITR